MMTTDRDRLAEIRARAAAARPGPWHHDSELIWPVAPSGPGDPEAGTSYPENAEFIAAAREDVPWLLDQLEQARVSLTVADAETDRLTEQLRQAPGWCLACPPGCVSCAGEGDCECYEHQDQHPEHLRAELEQARTEVAKLTVQLRHSEACALRELQAQEAAEDREAERDRARATAVRLEQELAAAEEARQVWAKTAQEQLADVQKELEHERSLSRNLASQGTAMATAIQRVRDLHRKASHGTDCVYCTGLDRQNNYDCTWPCDTIRALTGEVPDVD